MDLSMRPEMSTLYNLRLLPLTIERSATLAQLECEERHSIDSAQIAYNEERERVEEEWRKGRDRVRERLLEGIEERRCRAREDKEGEGTLGGQFLCAPFKAFENSITSSDATLDSTSRPHITRKLRNKLGTSPPPTPLTNGIALMNGTVISSLPITTGPFPNPHSLVVDELPSPFPLPLTSTTAPPGGAAANGTATAPTGRRRPKGNGARADQTIGGLGKSLLMLCGSKENEIDADLGEIRRGNKRRRATAASLTK